MTPADVAAWIGAAAWVPQIIRWLYKIWSKPRISIVPSSTAFLTYSNLGPTVHLDASFSSARQAALVERMEIDITHELGEKRHLTWVSLSEFGGQIRVPTGEVMDFGRDQPATAIKITTDALTDRRIVLQDSDFSQQSRTLDDQFLEHYRYLKPKHADLSAAVSAIIQSKEVRPAQEHFERGFYWKPGSYTVEITLKTTSSNEKHVQRFRIQLSTEDSERLSSNCKLFSKYVQYAIQQAEGLFSQSPQWTWVLVRISRSDESGAR